MSTERCRKIKAVLLIAMLAVSEAHQAGSRTSEARYAAEQSQAVTIPLPLQENAEYVSKQVETIMADPSFQEHAKHLAEQLEAFKADPHFQAQAKRVAEPIQEMLTDSKFQEQAKHMTEEMEAVKADPHFQEQAARVAQQMEEVLAEPGSQEQAQRLAQQLEAIMANPALQEQAKRLVEPMQAMAADPTFQEQAKRISQQMHEMLGDAKVQERAKRVVESLYEMMTDPSIQQQTTLLAEQIGAGAEHQELAARFAQQMEAIMGQSEVPVAQAKAEDSVDSAVDSLIDQLYSRTRTASPFDSEGLDDTALGKSGQLSRPTSRLSSAALPTRPRSRSSHTKLRSFQARPASIAGSSSVSPLFGVAPHTIAQRHWREPASVGLPTGRRLVASSSVAATSGITKVLLDTVAPTLGTIIANGMFFSSLPAILDARRKKTLGELNPLPFAMILAQCIAWLGYGLMTQNPYVWACNAPGILLGLFMTLVGVRLADEKTKGMMELVMLGATAIILASSLSAFFLTSAAARASLAGWVANGLLLLYYASPLSTLAKVINEKSSASLYPPLSLLALLNSSLWVSYGLAIKDLFIAAPNGAGVLLSTIQLALCFALPGAFGPKEKTVSPADPERPRWMPKRAR